VMGRAAKGWAAKGRAAKRRVAMGQVAMGQAGTGWARIGQVGTGRAKMGRLETGRSGTGWSRKKLQRTFLLLTGFFLISTLFRQVFDTGFWSSGALPPNENTCTSPPQILNIDLYILIL
jgi:hypothetical protein